MPIASLLDVWVVGSCGMARADAGGSFMVCMAMVDGRCLDWIISSLGGKLFGKVEFEHGRHAPAISSTAKWSELPAILEVIGGKCSSPPPRQLLLKARP